MARKSRVHLPGGYLHVMIRGNRSSDIFLFASVEYEKLVMEKPRSRPAGSDLINFYPKSLPANIYLSHLLTSGQVKADLKREARKS